jgi:hypothetical protein
VSSGTLLINRTVVMALEAREQQLLTSEAAIVVGAGDSDSKVDCFRTLSIYYSIKIVWFCSGFD